MELLQAAVLFNSLLQVGLVLGRDVLDLFVEPFNLELAHHVLLSELFKGSWARLFSFLSHAILHDIDCAHVLLWVAHSFQGRAKELDGALPEVADLALEGFVLERTHIFHAAWRDKSLVGVRLEQIHRHLSLLTLLEVAEDQVDPLGQGHTYRVRFECHTHLQDKVCGVGGPVGQGNVRNRVAHMI